MANISFARGAALFVAPMILASCGGSGTGTDQGLIKNSPDKALLGCTVDYPSCDVRSDPVIRSGVIVKEELGGPFEKSLHFFTLTDNKDGSYTYIDGDDEVVINQAELDAFLATFEVPVGFDFWPLAAAWGHHTDATVIPAGGTAEYLGTAGYHTDRSHLHDDGVSNLSVDFGAGTADLTAIFVPADGEPPLVIDRIEVPNMVIDGYSFTGDEVEVYGPSGLVDLTGANSEAASAGIFFGPIDEALNVPDGFGAVAILEGDDDAIWVSSSGLATESNLPAE